jgi:hypothetical protein
MKLIGVTSIFLLLICAGATSAFSQSQPDCKIQIDSKVTEAHAGHDDGKIQLIIENDNKDQFKVFLLNKGEDRAREEIKTRVVDKAKAGLFEFIIIDIKHKGCYKEYSVNVNNLR